MIGQLLFWKSAFPRERPRAALDIDGLFRRPAVLISRWLERGAERRRLQSLDDHILKDIGVSRCDVEREIRAGWIGR
jgi:uncharacterized protein YjiS (DUF1127 family)